MARFEVSIHTGTTFRSRRGFRLDVDLRHRRISLLHAQGVSWARIGEAVGHTDLMTTARTYTHVLADEKELDYAGLLTA